MRILLISHGFYPLNNVGGTELFTSEAAEFLSAEHEITVLVFVHPNTPKETVNSTQTFGKVRVVCVHGSKNNKANSTFRAKHFRKFLKSESPELIYIVSPYLLPFSLMKEAAKMGIPWIVQLNDFYLMCSNTNLLCYNGKLCKKPKRWQCTFCSTRKFRILSYIRNFITFGNRNRWAHFVIDNAKIVLCVSLNLAKIYSQFGLAFEKVIYETPILNQEMRPKSKVKRHDSLRIGFFGGSIPAKGLQVLAKALSHVHQPWKLKAYNIHDNNRKQIMELFKGVENKVELNGPFAIEELDKVCDGLDVLAVPSICPEAYGRVADEALSRGVVVVASDTGGLPEHIIDGLNAFLCPPGDYKTWAGKISYICENINNLRKSMKFDFALPRTEVYGEKLKRVCTAAASKEYTNGFFVDHKSDILRICEVTGNRENKVKQRLLKEIRKPGISVKTAWLEAGPPKNKEEIEAFYRSTDAYLYDLVVVHTTWERVTKRNRALSFLINNNCKTVLDYGAGIGKDSLLFASAGLDVTYYEPSKYLLRFAESAAKEEKTRLVTISEINLLEPASFDVIYCAKVLEHVVESMVEMVRISRLLKCGGYLLMTAGFNQTSEKFLSHLPSNVRYHERIDLLANKMKMSMREVIPIPGNRMYVFNRT